jgi:cyclophilin family peptidyl-prolyl cis-trans isomerase
VRTSCGTFDIRLDVRDSPKTSGSFAFLAGKHFYDGTTFYRVVPDFVIQGGDPKGDGTGGPGYTVVEPPPGNVRYPPGTVAMAKTRYEASGTSGSQFFVVTGSSAQFAPEYALLGRVSGGRATVDRIAAAPADPRSGRPNQPIVIDSIRVAAN